MPNPIAPELPQPLRAGTSRAPIWFRLRRPGNFPTDSDSTITRPGRYEEIVEGESYLRLPPGARHELICSRLHDLVAAAINSVSTTRLLERRSVVQLSSGTMVRPDLSLVTAATGKIWLAAEIISSDDHRPDTVTKKQIYEDLNIPRLWMIDTRYNNLEVYHGSQYGLMLKRILAGRELLTEQLLPTLQVTIAELFQG